MDRCTGCHDITEIPLKTAVNTIQSVNQLISTLYHTSLTFNNPDKKAFKNIFGNGENAGNQYFLLFPQCFLLIPLQNSVFESHLFCYLQTLSIWSGLNLVKS